jgi:chorismate dehydratase
MTLNVGHIAYLNCVPFFHYLREVGFEGNIVQGVPSQLNAMLAEGKLDLSPSSSFEYGLHWQKYVLLPDLSISSKGPVQSVLLFSPCSLQELEGRQVALTGESATSVNLLKILLKEFVGLREVDFQVPEISVEECIEQRQPALLIGDRALKMSKRCPPGCRIYDLGELWYQYTGKPFVFALWIVRREAAENKRRELDLLKEKLKTSLEKSLKDKKPLALDVSDNLSLTVSEITEYWTIMDYRLEKDHIEGLELYFDLCHLHGLLPDKPRIDFFSES